VNLKQRIDSLAERVEAAGLLEDLCWACAPDQHRRLGSLVIRSMADVRTCPECGAPVDHDGKALGTDVTIVHVHGRNAPVRNRGE
jgi:hypothetical protein